MNLTRYKQIIEQTSSLDEVGKVTEIVGLIIEADGPKSSIGDLCYIYNRLDEEPIWAEVVGFKTGKILLMPLGSMEGLMPGAIVKNSGGSMKIKVGPQLLGRVLDGLGNPIDNLGEINSQSLYSTQSEAINPLNRSLIRTALPLGIRAIDGFITAGKGQRLGIFAGSGVGKSTTLAMMAKNTEADLNVIALIGERGREVREFIESTLGAEGMKRSIVVVATSEQPSLVKIKAAFVATAIAEYFRDQGRNVLLMMDSVTRFGRAQREIGLAAGEPPTRRGFPPSVFSTLPKLMERAGNSDKGSITALYTVLVEGDDMTEPIADETRSILDGHIILSRKLAAQNHYPAIDVQASVSRVMNAIVSKEHKQAAQRLRQILAKHAEIELLVQLGEYKKGSDKEADFALSHIEAVNAFLKQGLDEKSSFDETLKKLLEVVK